MELITVKEYCKSENITDAGARKRVKQKLANSIILNDITYIIVDSNKKDQEIKRLKNKLRNANDRIKLLKSEAQTIINQSEYINRLETKLEKLEDKVEKINDKKEELYEKVIGQMNMLLPSTIDK